MSEEMQKHEYARLAHREPFYFWNVGRREIIEEALLRHIHPSAKLEVLDLGCGPGDNFQVLEKFGRVTGVDLSEEALKFARNKGFVNLLLADVASLPFVGHSFDIVSSFDVFEHIADDRKAMREAYRVLKPGGFLVITVPAHPWLWSAHDEALRHQRRYRTKEFLAKFAQGGFGVLEHSHFVTLAVPVNFLRKVRDQAKKWIFGGDNNEKKETYDVVFPPLLNSFLTLVLRIEKSIIRFFSLPFGSSMIVVARKPNE